MKNMNKRSQLIIFSVVVLILLIVLGVVFFKDTLFNNSLNTLDNTGTNNVKGLDIEESLPVNIFISNNFGNTTQYTYNFVEGKSVLDVLKELDNLNEDLSVAYTEDPTFGAYINNFNNYELDTSSQFWEFLVNGEQSTVGISSYIVSPGDSIEFKITTFN